MFGFFKKNKNNVSPDFSVLEADMHSHLLPGIDDGAPDMAESLALIQKLYDLGYRRLYTTPHIFKEFFPNTSEIIREKLAEVQAAVKEAGIDVTIEAAAEYFLDEHFVQLLQQQDLLTLPGKRVLIEMSTMAPYQQIDHIVFELRTKGYTPVLAHPERYTYYQKQWDALEHLHDIGCLFQCNLLSFGNYYGKPIRDMAQKLLAADLVDLLGTDLHNSRHAEHLTRLINENITSRLFEKHTYLNRLLS